MAIINGTPGNDPALNGTPEADIIDDGAGGADTINALEGDDQITSTGGGDNIAGGAGTDRLIVNFRAAANVSVTGSALSGDFAGGYGGVLDGSGGDDVIFSGIEHFSLIGGGAGIFDLRTGDGNDVLTGGAGSDILRSGGGIDVIDGGGGVDRWGADLSAAVADITIDLNGPSSYLGAGSVVNIENFELLTTGAGNDRITSTATGSFAETINAGAGDDVVALFGRAGDVVNGGAGSDRLSVTFNAAVNTSVSGGISSGDFANGYGGVLDGSGGDDVIFTGIESFTLIGGGAGVFNLTTGGGNDVLVGGAGADTLNSGAGVDNVDGGAGIDRWGADMSAASQDVVIDLGAAGGSTFLGTGSVVNVEGFTTLSTGAGNDRITSTATGSFAETINGGAGDDVIALFGKGGDSANGEAGSDRLSVVFNAGINTSVSGGVSSGNLADGFAGVFDGSGGDDVTFTGIESFTLIGGGSGTFNLTTGGGNDVLVGGNSADLLNSGAGVDSVDGGLGVDAWGADMSAASEAIVIDLGAAAGSTFLGIGSVINVEGFTTLSTGSGNDRITSTAIGGFAETVNAGAGDDVVSLFGRGGDTVNGGRAPTG
jgi:Ca2+-binding RTX toxin-like protein